MEGLYYPCSGNKGADQLRGYREANLRICFSHMQKAGCLITRLIFNNKKTSYTTLCLSNYSIEPTNIGSHSTVEVQSDPVSYRSIHITKKTWRWSQIKFAHSHYVRKQNSVELLYQSFKENITITRPCNIQTFFHGSKNDFFR